ncbi:MAG: sensor histidine kinase [Microcoleus sp.]
MKNFKLKRILENKKSQILQQSKPNRQAVFVPILAGITLAIIAVTSISYQLVRQIILQEIRENVLLKVQQSTGAIDDWLETRQAEIETIASTPIVRSLKWSAAETYLKSEVDRLQEFEVLLLAKPNGVTYNTQIGLTATNIKDRDYFQQAMAGKIYISDPIIARTSRRPVVPIAVPIRPSLDRRKKPIGVFGGSIGVQQVTDVVSTLNYGNGSYAFALSSQGVPIFHPDPKQRGTAEKLVPSFLAAKDQNLRAIARKMVNKQQGIKYTEFDGTWKYIAYAPLKQANWSIALIIPRENIESQLLPLNLLTSIVSLLLVLAIIGAWRQLKLFEKTQEQVIMLRDRATELKLALADLKQTQTQLVQSEKMSSLGQMVAGIAHEINNPVSFIHGNLAHVQEYAENLIELIGLYKKNQVNLPEEIDEFETEIELDFIQEDLPQILSSMQQGSNRIRDIVISLRNFSRLDEAETKEVDLHEGINSTLLLLHHKLTDIQIQTITNYGVLPLIECYPSQLNQVFMNIIINAVEVLETVREGTKEIRIATKLIEELEQPWIKIAIANTGPPIPEEITSKIFDPFFTTKPVGQGTGLGLAISYKIVTEEHGGRLSVNNLATGGVEFAIEIPVKAIDRM